jgi:hypothetical protein
LKINQDTPRSAVAAQALILINAIFWLAFSIFATLGLLPGTLSTGAVRWVMAILSLGAAGFLGGLAFYLKRRVKAAYFIGLLSFVLMSILSITDQVGLFDWLILIISLATFVLLLISRKWYLDSAGDGPDTP